MTAADIFRRATAAHRAGDRATAERLARELLTAHPDQPDAHSLLGLLLVQAGERTAALPHWQKAAERGISATFLVNDALALADWGERFDNVIDSGLFHVFSDDDRRRYVRGLARVLEPGGRLFLMCMSDEEPGTEGPRRVSRQELYDAFADGWEVESVKPCRIEVNPESDVKLSEGGPKAWFAVVRREG